MSRTAHSTRRTRLGQAVAVVTVLLLGLVAAPATAAAPDAGTQEPAGATGERVRDALRGLLVPRAVDLGVPGQLSEALMVSDTGVDVGTFRDDLSSPPQVFRWREGRLETLTDPGYLHPSDVNSAGQVVVTGAGAFGRGEGYVWDVDGTLHELFDTDAGSGGDDINDRGQATFSFVTMSSLWPGRWDIRTGPQLIQVEEAVESAPSSGRSINERGEVLANYTTDWQWTTTTGFVWHDGVYRYLRAPDGASVNARAINDRGQVLADVAGTGAVLWEPDGRMRPLDPRGLGFTANILTERGVAAGTAIDAATMTTRAATADVRGVTVLRSYGTHPSALEALTDHGIGAGWAERDADGDPHATVWVLGRPVALGEKLGTATAPRSVAHDVNERGLVVGTLTTVPGTWQAEQSRAVVWDLLPRR